VTSPVEQRWSLRAAIERRRPPAPTPAITRLRALIALTAVAVVVVETLNFTESGSPGFSLVVRTVWALARVVGLLVLIRMVRFGRAFSRPFGLILAVTTVFAVARLTAPRAGSLVPPVQVLVGFGVLAVLCGTIVGLLYRSPAVAQHLAHRPVRRHVPPSVLTVRVAALSYAALVAVPLLVGVGTLGGDERRHPLALTTLLLGVWAALLVVLLVVMGPASAFLVFGKAWARWVVGILSVAVLVLQPMLCYAVLGVDGLLRDGAPLVVTAVVGLVALHRSRGRPTWVRVPA